MVLHRLITVLAYLAPLRLPAQGRPAAPSTDSLRVHAVGMGIIAAGNTRALERVRRYYTPDAVLLPPNDPPSAGLARIRPRSEALCRDFDPQIETHMTSWPSRTSSRTCAAATLGLRGRRAIPDRALDDVYLVGLRRRPTGDRLISQLMWHSAGGVAQP